MFRQIFFFLFFFLSSLLASEEFCFSGYVKERETGKPLPKVKISILPLSQAVETNQDGFFKFPALKSGQYQVEIKKAGFEEIKFEITLQQDLEKNIFLEKKTYILEEVVVKTSRFRIKEGTGEVLSPRKIRLIPGAAKDIFWAIQTLPGIGSTGSAPLYIRGGRDSENLILVDGIQLRAPFHLESTGGGLFSILNSDLLQEVEVITGGFPASYGDKLSAVIDIKTRPGNEEKYQHMLSFHMAGVEGLSEGPLFFAKKGSYLFSARRSFFDLIMRMMKFEVKFAEYPNYFDLMLKVNYPGWQNHQLNFTTLYAYSGMAVITDEKKDEKYEFESKKSGMNLNLISLFGEKLSLKTSFSFGSGEMEEKVKPYFESKIWGENFQLREDLLYLLSPAQKIEAGFIFDRLQTEEKFLKGEGTKYTFYLQDRLSFKKRWQFLPGLRLSYFTKNKEFCVDPRLNVSFSPRPHLWVYFHTGLFHQFPSPAELERMKPSTPTSSQAVHYILGGEYSVKKNLTFRLEVYYKDLWDLISWNQGKYENSGFGFARGVEVFFEKRTPSFHLWFSYAFSKAKRKEKAYQDLILFDFDQPHIFTVVYQHNQLPWGLKFGAKWRYLTGRPKTPVVGKTAVEDNRLLEGNKNVTIWNPVWGEPNSERYPPFHQLEARITREFEKGRQKWMIFWEIFNLYGRKNPVFYRWDRKKGKEVPIYAFPGTLFVGGMEVIF